jgi:acyl carrier protein
VSGATEAELVDWCVQFVAELLERAPRDVDPQARFSRVGVDSTMAVQLIVALEDKLRLALPPDLILDYPSISRLSAHLATLAD